MGNPFFLPHYIYILQPQLLVENQEQSTTKGK